MEQWDQAKLLQFMHKYNVQGKELAVILGMERSHFSYLKNNKRSFEPFNNRLTAFKNALKHSKIAEAKAFCDSMVKYYEED